MLARWCASVNFCVTYFEKFFTFQIVSSEFKLFYHSRRSLPVTLMWVGLDPLLQSPLILFCKLGYPAIHGVFSVGQYFHNENVRTNNVPCFHLHLLPHTHHQFLKLFQQSWCHDGTCICKHHNIFSYLFSEQNDVNIKECEKNEALNSKYKYTSLNL